MDAALEFIGKCIAELYIVYGLYFMIIFGVVYGGNFILFIIFGIIYGIALTKNISNRFLKWLLLLLEVIYGLIHPIIYLVIIRKMIETRGWRLQDSRPDELLILFQQGYYQALYVIAWISSVRCFLPCI